MSLHVSVRSYAQHPLILDVTIADDDPELCFDGLRYEDFLRSLTGLESIEIDDELTNGHTKHPESSDYDLFVFIREQLPEVGHIRTGYKLLRLIVTDATAVDAVGRSMSTLLSEHFKRKHMHTVETFMRQDAAPLFDEFAY